MYVLKAAMEAAKTTGDPSKVVAERAAIRDTLGKLTYNNLVIGDGICFDKVGDAQLPGYILTMNDKKWTMLDSHAPLPCK